MDRNYYADKDADWVRVALRKESVDRNHDLNLDWIIDTLSLSARRAWIEMIQFVPITTSDVWSLSARRAWIEIEDDGILSTGAPVALRKESVDRNICDHLLNIPAGKSLSARRAWIEIPTYRWQRSGIVVALRKESVDRNNIALASMRAFTTVALRKESVDRNLIGLHLFNIGFVALRKESVDRNNVSTNYHIRVSKSLSARRAWIEIVKSTPEEAKR